MRIMPDFKGRTAPARARAPLGAKTFPGTAQGSFCVWVQAMRDGITLFHHLSLAGRIYRIIPAVMTHYNDGIMSVMATQIISLTIIYLSVYSDADQRKHQSSVSLAFVRGIHRGPVTSPHKWPVMWKMPPFDDVIMQVQVYSHVTPAFEGLHHSDIIQAS